MNISIFGLGYVGAVSLACLARDGHNVIGVDVDQMKLDLIAAGKTPVVEQGMVELVERVATSGRVRLTSGIDEAVRGSEVSLICVGTPSAPNGNQDLSAILRLAHDIGRVVKEKAEQHVFVFRSTIAPGTVEDVIRPIVETESGKKDGEHFHLCFQPEFLREGTSIRDYDRPPFTKNCGLCSAICPALFTRLRCVLPRWSSFAATIFTRSRSRSRTKRRVCATLSESIRST